MAAEVQEGELKEAEQEPEPKFEKWSVRHELFDATRWKAAGDGGEKPLSEFYATQDECVQAFHAVETLRRGESLIDGAQDAAEAKSEQRAVSLSFWLNVLLFIAKLVAAVMTGSMIVLVSTLDSALDLLSGGILFVTALVARKPNPTQYPLGKAKMEPLGIVVFSALMGMSALMVAVESLKALVSTHECPAAVPEAELEGSSAASVAEGEGPACLPSSYTVDVAIMTAAILAGVVVVKAALFVYCRRVQALRGSATVGAYADDHFNDALANAVSVAVFCLA